MKEGWWEIQNFVYWALRPRITAGGNACKLMETSGGKK